MNPITVSVSIPRSRPEVYAWLNVNANHQQLLEHMWTDFSFSGPPRGVGARLRARSRLPGPADWSEIEVVEAQSPSTIVERGVGGGGKRRTQGTYRLAAREDAGTDVTFELRIERLPIIERVATPLIRFYLRRSLTEAMRRLRAALSPA